MMDRWINPHTNIEKKTRVFEYAGSTRTPKAYLCNMKAKINASWE